MKAEDRAMKSFNPGAVNFRAKEKGTKDWVYGWYEKYPFGKWPASPSIIPFEDLKNGIYNHIMVDESTVGQFTGLYDSTKTPIFTGDIVKNHLGIEQVVVFEGGAFKFIAIIDFIYGERQGDCFCACEKRYIDYDNGITKDTIVGNIFDNPEKVDKTTYY